MEYQVAKECTCPVETISLDFSVNLEENEDLEEIDEDELTEDPVVLHTLVWKEICDKFDNDRREIEMYKKSKCTDCDVLSNPAVQFLQDEIFPYLVGIMETTINKAKELDSIKRQKSPFNGIDHIAEMLWNLNPKYPQRREKWSYIFDMDWAIEWLKDHPRPFYPFSLIWSRDYAATKIQAAMRGHWVRCREDVQEMRQFWRVFARAKETGSEKSQNSLSEQPNVP